MEPTEITNEQLPQGPNGLLLPDEALYYLQKSGEWARFLGILGFIASGFIVLCSLFIGSIFSMMSAYQSTPYPAGIGGFVSFVYILMAVFYFVFSLYLYKFGNKAKNGVAYNDPIEVTAALSKLKSFFKLWGITAIVIISVYILAIIGIFIGASMMHKF